MDVMDVLMALFTITLPIVATVLLTNRQTNSILHKLERCMVKISQTQEEVVKTQHEIKRIQEDTACTLEKVRKIQEDMTCLLRKVDLGLKANAVMHGWRRADGISCEKADEFPEPKVYDPELRICYYKPVG